MYQMMFKKMMVRVLLLLAFGALLITSGCAANASRMMPADFEIANRHPATVSLSDSIGGQETNPLWTSQISNSAFTEALSNALVKSGIFSEVIKASNADYILDVTIVDYNKPWAGIDFDIRMTTTWELTDGQTLLPVWSETFETIYHAKFSEALFAAERLQKANEGAVRVNIKEGIRRLSLLKLKTT